MRVRTRTIAAAAAVSAALAAGGGVALAAGGTATVASTPATHAKTVSDVARSKLVLKAGRPNNDPFIAAVARELHLSFTTVRSALQPAFPAGRIDPSSPAFAAAARSLGVSTQQLATALVHAKESLAPAGPANQKMTARAQLKLREGTGPVAQRLQSEFVAAVASRLHVSTATVSAALRRLFAAGNVGPTSPAFAAAARSLGVSTQQLSNALMHAKQSMAQGTNAQAQGGSK